MASKLRNSHWFNLNINIDPWAYENLLSVQKEIGAKTESAALRYILGRSLELVGKKRRATPVPPVRVDGD